MWIQRSIAFRLSKATASAERGGGGLRRYSCQPVPKRSALQEPQSCFMPRGIDAHLTQFSAEGGRAVACRSLACSV